jgi:hypothetical protein
MPISNVAANVPTVLTSVSALSDVTVKNTGSNEVFFLVQSAGNADVSETDFRQIGTRIAASSSATLTVLRGQSAYVWSPSGSTVFWTNGGTLISVSPGGTNDHTTINDALQTVKAAGGGTVQLSSGTFWLTESILIPSNCRLEGAGRIATVLRMTDGRDRPVIINESGPTGDSNIAIRNLHIFAGLQTRRSATRTTTAEITNGNHWQSPAVFLNCTGLVIENIINSNCGGNGIMISGGRGGALRNIEFRQVSGAASNMDAIHMEGSQVVQCANWVIENIQNTSGALALNDNIIALIAANYYAYSYNSGDISNVTVRNVECGTLSAPGVSLVSMKLGSGGTQTWCRNIVIDNISGATASSSVPLVQIIGDGQDGTGNSSQKLQGGTMVDTVQISNVRYDCPAGGLLVKVTPNNDVDLSATGYGDARNVRISGIVRTGATPVRSSNYDILLSGSITSLFVENCIDSGSTGGSKILSNSSLLAKYISVKNCQSTGVTGVSMIQLSGQCDRLEMSGNYMDGNNYLGNLTHTASSGTPIVQASGNTLVNAYAMFTNTTAMNYVLYGNVGTFSENVIRPNGSSIAVTIRGAGNSFSGSLSSGTIFANAGQANIRVHSPDFPVSDITRLYGCVQGDLVWRSAGTVGLNKVTVTGTAGTGGAAGTAATLVAL